MRRIVIVGLAVALVGCSSADKDAAGAGGTLATSGPAIATLAAGTTLQATIQEPISSGTNAAGQQVKGVVSLNVVDDRGRIVIPGGAPIVLTIAQLRAPKNSSGVDGIVTLDMKSVTVRDSAYATTASVGAVAHSLKAGSTAADRDVVVAPGTPITIKLTQPLKIAAK